MTAVMLSFIISDEVAADAGTESSPFDFLLDPGGLVAETGAARYGGGSVEEGATLLFHNREGAYTFSKDSDKLTIMTPEPAEIFISAYLSELGELMVVEDRDFSGSDVCGIYLALVDDRGNEQPLSADGEISATLHVEPGSYSFGLTGACNPDADWQNLSANPKVTLTWSVEAAESEEEKAAFSEEEDKEKPKMQKEDTQEPAVPEDEEKDSISEAAEPDGDRPPMEEGAVSEPAVPESDFQEPDGSETWKEESGLTEEESSDGVEAVFEDTEQKKESENKDIEETEEK